MVLRGGAIIIGSLLWDEKEERKKWRENNLDCKNKFQVYLPIRYGRRSTSRRNTYTIVFSNICYSKRYGLGTGWILPLKSKITSFDDLKIEAQKMGEAEGFGINKLSTKWGVVALLLNPNRKVNDSIKNKWAELMRDKMSTHDLLTRHLKTEKPVVDSNGFLTIRWPEEVISENKIEKLDFLLATATVPTLTKGRYPTVYQIASAMKREEYSDYFENNIKNRITTFQDKKILKRLPKNIKEKIRKNCIKLN